MPIRTTEKVRDLVTALQEDIGEAVSVLEKGRDILTQLEPECRGLNGTGTTLASVGKQLDELISRLREESETVERKMLGSRRPEIVENVNPELAEAARREREA